MGGTRTYFIKLLNFFHKYNFDVCIINTNNFVDNEIHQIITNYRYNFFNVRLNTITGVIKFLKLKFKYCPTYTILSVGTPGLFLHVLFYSQKVYYILHTYPNQSSTIRNTVFRYCNINWFLSKQKKIITVSKYAKKQIIQFWKVIEHNVLVVSNSSSDPIFFKTKKNNNQIVVLTIGHVINYKNPKLWIEVAINIIKKYNNKNIIFKWIGEGPVLSECIDIVAKAKLENVIQFLGFDKDVEYHYQEANIYLHPSLIENLSFSIIDALKFKLPCIVSDVGGSPELIQNNINGFLVDPNDKNKFEKCLSTLIENHEIANNMGNESYTIFNKYFRNDIWEHKMLNLFIRN